MNNIELLLPAFAKKQLSDSGGRQVVDKMFDVSLNRRIVEWSGTDRPEFTDLDGAKVCVEAERTNLFLNSDSLSTQAVMVSSEPYTVSMEGTGSITFSGAHTGTLEGVEGERVSTTFTPSAGSVTCTVSGTVTNAQFEAGSYPTNYIPTSGTPVTRLAPTVPIEDALPETGTVAGVVDMVRTVGAAQYIIDNGRSTGAGRFLLNIAGTGNFVFLPFAAAFAINTPFPFAVSDNARFTLEYAGSYDGSNAYLFVRVGMEQYMFTGSYTVGDDSVRDVEMGSRNGSGQSSMRWEVFHHKDEIIRTTESEFEQLFEVIS